MPDQNSPSQKGRMFEKTLDSLLPHDELHVEPDWAGTIRNLMALAKRANKNFDYDRAINYLDNLEEVWDSKGLPEFSLDLRFELHREKGRAFAAKGKLEKAIAEYQKILTYCRDSSHLPVKSETFTQIGQLLAKQGDHDRALGYVQRAIGAYRRMKDTKGICKALRNLGVIYVELGEFEEAELNYQEAIELARNLDDDILYADMINNLGAIMNMKGNWKKAIEYYTESLKIYESNNQIRKSAYTKNNMGITLAEQGINDEAFEYFQQAYQIAISIKDESLTLIVDINLGDLFIKRNGMANAKIHIGRAEKYFREANIVNGHLVEVKRIAGKIAWHEKKYDQALSCFNESLRISREAGTRFLEAEVLLERGTLLRRMKRNFEALNDLEASYHIYASVKADGKRDQTERVIRSIEKLYLEIFDSMAKEVEAKDHYTKGHSDRVASLALLLGKELGIKINMLKTIVAAGLLHDIGKIEIEDGILKKAGRLSNDEFQHIKKHPEIGVELLRGKELPWDIKPIILHHHEKIDGTGYPMGLKGEDIPLEAKIICIADVFDALTSDRVYRKAYDVDQALVIMKKDSGSAFDPVIYDVFEELILSGKANMVINSRTGDQEMYSIWSQCKMEDTGKIDISQMQDTPASTTPA